MDGVVACYLHLMMQADVSCVAGVLQYELLAVNRRVVQHLLGFARMGTIVRYIGGEIDDVLVRPEAIAI